MLRNPYELEFGGSYYGYDNPVRKSFPKMKNHTELKGMLQEMEKDFRNQEELSNDTKYLLEIFTIGVTLLRNTNYLISSKCTDIQCFETNSLDAMHNLYSQVIHNSNIITFDLFDKFREFFISASNLNRNKSYYEFKNEWKKTFISIYMFVYNSHKWYLFLNYLNNEIFTIYELQKHIKSNNDHHTYSEILEKHQNSRYYDDTRLVAITLSNLILNLKGPSGHYVLNGTLKGNFSMLRDSMKDVELNNPKVKFFKILFDETFKDEVSQNCVNDNVEIKGNYVMLSDVMLGDVMKDCANPDIRIFALKKFYVDCDFHYPDVLKQISIIAPIWEIVNDHSITLTYIGKYGRAGDFLGISHNVINPHLLRIRNTVEVGDVSEIDNKNIRNLYENKIKCEKEEKSRIDQRKMDSICNAEIENKNGYNNHFLSRGTCFLDPSNCTDFSKIFRSGYVIFMISGQQSALQFTDPSAAEKYRNERQKFPKRGCSRKKGMINSPCVEFQFDRDLIALQDDLSVKYLRDNSDDTWQEEYFDIVPSVINNYKKYVRERLSHYINDEIDDSSLINFTNEISNVHLYNSLGLVSEVEDLVIHSFNLRENKSLLFRLYQQLLHRMQQYEFNDDYKYMDKKVLNYLIALILNKIRSINNLENNFPRNSIDYLDETIVYINKVMDQLESRTRYDYNEYYQKYILNRIDEANNLIENKIMPEIHSVFPKMERKIESLINETIKIIHNIKDEKQQLEKNKKRLENALVLRYILGFTKIAGMFLSFLGPLGAAVGITIGTGITIAEGIWVDGNSQVDASKKVALPPAVMNSMKIISKKYEDEQERFKNQLEDAKKYLDSNLDRETSSELKSVTAKMSKTLEDMKKLQDGENGASINQEAIDRWRRYKTSTMEILFQKKDVSQSQKVKDRLTHAQSILTIGEMSLDLYREIANNQKQIGDIDNAIRMANMKAELLQGYQSTIYSTLIPMSRKLEENVNNTTNRLKGLSLVALDLSVWKIKGALKDVEADITKMTEGFEVQEDLIYYIDKIRDGMLIMIKMYSNIQIYEEATRFIEYVANINLGKSWENTINDRELKSAIKHLEHTIRLNVISEKYVNCKSVFKHQVFPFAGYYLENYIGLELPFMRSKIDNSLEDVVKVIEDFKVYLNRHRTGRNKYRSIMHKNVTFGCGSKYVPPFFIWNTEHHRDAIQKLFEGEEIELISDIGQGINKNAIKFNAINIRFSLNNNAMQDEFDTLLENFDLKMTHLGTSNYRCDDRFYEVINANTEVISYTYSKNCNEKPELTNAVYDDLANYPPVLSPYAKWRIQLTENGLGRSFDELSKFKNQKMELLLEGKGEYVDLDIPEVCNQKMSEKYYTEVAGPYETNYVNFTKHANDKQATNMHARYSHKVRRDVNENELVEDIDKSLVATNGGCSNLKSSFMNNFFNLFGNSLMIFKHWVPEYDVSQWFINHNEKQHIPYTDHTIDKKFFNICSSQKTVPDSLNWSADKESPTTENSLNTSLFCNNANLLLLDAAIRWKNGNKYKQQYRMASNGFDVEYAQHLAYKSYAHKDD